MRASFIFGWGLWLSVTLPYSAAAQAPTAENQPRLAVPARGAVIQQAAPTEQAAPPAQTPGQPTTTPDPAPGPVTPFTGGAGVTKVGSQSDTTQGSSQATASSSQAATMDIRGFSAGKFGLSLDGIPAGFMKSVEGGTAVGNVESVSLGPDNATKKHVSNLKYEDIIISTTLDAKPVMDWVAASWKGGPQRKTGSVLETDYNSIVRREREFVDALVTATTFPTLDAGSKDAASIIVQISPESARLKAGSGTTLKNDVKSQRKWLASSFRFEMTGLDGSRVTRIESFTVGQPVVIDEIGTVREPQKHPTNLTFPNLKITLAESSAQTWSDWYDDFLLKGNNGDEKERNGSIVYLDQTLKGELGRINLFNCGIIRLSPTKAQAGSESIRRLEAELYCERMELVTQKA